MTVWLLAVTGVAAVGVIGILAGALATRERGSDTVSDDVRRIADDIDIITDD